MLVRVQIENFMSFGKETEFNMLPNRRYRKMEHHLNKYQERKKEDEDHQDFEYLRMAAIYGANAAGKSNLIKAIKFLKSIVLDEEIPADLHEKKFRLHNKSKNKPITIGIEFIVKDTPCIYAMQVDDQIIVKEELYESGLGLKDDKLIFERQSTKDKTEVKFYNEFYEIEENVLLSGLIEKNLSKPFKPILKLLDGLNNDYLKVVRRALFWLTNRLHIIDPNTRPSQLAHWIDVHPEFYEYMRDTIQSFHVGIKDIEIEKITAKEFFGNDDEKEIDRILKTMDEKKIDVVEMANKDGDLVCIVRENGKIIVKRLRFVHEGDNENQHFLTSEESDGTKRLLELAPAFLGIIKNADVFLIDEIERSLHPLLIKEMLRIISKKKDCRGQLIFTTHESNLLDQNIFRKDEIWFVEKDKLGNSDIYSLSDFKEHHTIDIRKGYLNGRYGAIPFLGNLKDLNWMEYDYVEE